MKKTLSLVLAAALAALLTGCGGNDGGWVSASGSAPAAQHEPVIINFPTAGSGGALYAVGAAVSNLWDTEIPYVSASSQASGVLSSVAPSRSIIWFRGRLFIISWGLAPSSSGR